MASDDAGIRGLAQGQSGRADAVRQRLRYNEDADRYRLVKANGQVVFQYATDCIRSRKLPLPIHALAAGADVHIAIYAKALVEFRRRSINCRITSSSEGWLINEGAVARDIAFPSVKRTAIDDVIEINRVRSAFVTVIGRKPDVLQGASAGGRDGWSCCLRHVICRAGAWSEG